MRFHSIRIHESKRTLINTVVNKMYICLVTSSNDKKKLGRPRSIWMSTLRSDVVRPCQQARPVRPLLQFMANKNKPTEPEVP